MAENNDASEQNRVVFWLLMIIYAAGVTALSYIGVHEWRASEAAERKKESARRSSRLGGLETYYVDDQGQPLSEAEIQRLSKKRPYDVGTSRGLDSTELTSNSYERAEATSSVLQF